MIFALLPFWEQTSNVRIFSRSTLRDYWEKHPQAKPALSAWHHEVERATWQGPTDIKAQYQSADFVAGDRVIFNIQGNSYRLIVHVKYATEDPPFKGFVHIRFVGSHAEYNNVDATTI